MNSYVECSYRGYRKSILILPLPQSLRNGTYTWLAIPGKILNIKELQRGVQSRPSMN